MQFWQRSLLALVALVLSIGGGVGYDTAFTGPIRDYCCAPHAPLDTTMPT